MSGRRRIPDRFFGITTLLSGFQPLDALPGRNEVYRTYTVLAWPAALEGALMMLFSSVDLLMVSTLGAAAVAAVGIISQPRMLILTVCRSLGVAVTALSARRIGQRHLAAVNSCLKQSLLFQCVVGLLILIPAMVYTEEIVLLAGAKADYLGLAVTYGRYVLVGIFFTSLGVIINSVQIGVGNTRIVMIANVGGNLVNIMLNALLIFGLGPFPVLGVTGAAIGTLAGNIVTLAISVSNCRGPVLSLVGPGRWRFEAVTTLPLRRVGISAFSEQLFERIGMWIYTVLVADLGTVALATHFICMELCNISYALAMGLGRASTSLTGQKLGEQRPDLAVIYAHAGQRLGVVVGVIAAVGYLVFREPLIQLFSRESGVVELGSTVMIFVAVVCAFQFQSQVYAGVLRGAGDTRFVATYSLISIAVVRPIITWALCYPLGLGLVGAWTALVIDQITRAVCSSWRVRKPAWTEIPL